MSEYTEDFVQLIKHTYGNFHNNRNGIYNDLNIFYILEFTFITGDNMVRCLWHKDWDHISIHWNFNAKEHLDKKVVAWSMPRDVPLSEIGKQFNGLSEVLFKDAAVHTVTISDGEL